MLGNRILLVRNALACLKTGFENDCTLDRFFLDSQETVVSFVNDNLFFRGQPKKKKFSQGAILYFLAPWHHKC